MVKKEKVIKVEDVKKIEKKSNLFFLKGFVFFGLMAYPIILMSTFYLAVLIFIELYDVDFAVRVLTKILLIAGTNFILCLFFAVMLLLNKFTNWASKRDGREGRTPKEKRG